MDSSDSIKLNELKPEESKYEETGAVAWQQHRLTASCRVKNTIDIILILHHNGREQNWGDLLLSEARKLNTGIEISYPTCLDLAIAKPNMKIKTN